MGVPLVVAPDLEAVAVAFSGTSQLLEGDSLRALYLAKQACY